MERVEEADAEVVAVAGRDVRVRARHADGRDAGLLERVGRGDGHAGAVGAEHERNLLVDELGSRRDSLGGVGAVVGVDELDLVGLAADVHGGGHVVGVLHTQHFLLAAGTGVAGSRLKYADLYDFFTGSGVRTALAVAAGIAGAVSAAGRQTHGHSQRQHDGNKLLHSIHPPCEIRTAQSVRTL